jgi:ABC-type lipoprotein export system ATPase subunit
MNLFSKLNKDKEDNEVNKEEKPIVSVSDKINEHFKIPIFYNKDKIELKENIATDLELVKTIDPSGVPIYSFYFNDDNNLSKKVTEQVVKYYTTDTTFLQDNQKLLKEYTPIKNKYTEKMDHYKNILKIWNEIKLDQGFREKYYYVDWEILEFLNRSEIFLQFISIYNLFSPIFSLMMPIFILIIPFFIIRMRGLKITMNEYIEVLKIVAQTNSIGKLFTTNFNDIGTQEKIYIIISAAFYLFSIYQNLMVCLRFNQNMKKIHGYFENVVSYLNYTIENMENYLLFSKKLDSESHNEFNQNIISKMNILKNIKQKLSTISEYSVYNFSKFREIGSIFKYFYELHTDVTYNDAIVYSLGFNGYIDCLIGLQQNIEERNISFVNLIKNKEKNTDKNRNKKYNMFKKSYYACLVGKKHVKNNIKLKKNIIITGPNASGKTTILKSTLINIILSQQFGCGFYDSAQLTPYKHIHCYLNIPDTSGRDSLFQAEARRCKEILNCINDHPEDSHFCVFDELYSGTNPEEAEISATSFMIYLQKYKLVSNLLTTHFVKVCKNLEKMKTIQNYKMVTELNKDKKLIYTYKMDKGISEVKGGINVLTELNYPKEIIDRTISESNCTEKK